MNDLFVDMLDICVVVYLNNILIYSNNLIEHTKQVTEVLHWLRANSLYASSSKCKFHHNWVEFLGYILSLEGLQIDENKMKAIHKWPTSHWLKDL